MIVSSQTDKHLQKKTHHIFILHFMSYFSSRSLPVAYMPGFSHTFLQLSLCLQMLLGSQTSLHPVYFSLQAHPIQVNRYLCLCPQDFSLPLVVSVCENSSHFFTCLSTAANPIEAATFLHISTSLQ